MKKYTIMVSGRDIVRVLTDVTHSVEDQIQRGHESSKGRIYRKLVKNKRPEGVKVISSFTLSFPLFTQPKKAIRLCSTVFRNITAFARDHPGMTPHLIVSSLIHDAENGGIIDNSLGNKVQINVLLFPPYA